MDLRTNSDNFRRLIYLIDYYNTDGVCLVHSKSSVFSYGQNSARKSSSVLVSMTVTVVLVIKQQKFCNISTVVMLLLKVLYLYLWGYLKKTLVCSATIENEVTLD
jgi:hypothetical protein